MVFRQLFDSVSSTYTYLLGDPASREAVLIDPVFEHHLRDAALVGELGLRLTHVLETHVHADHVTGAWLLKERFGARIVLSARSGARRADLLVSDGDVIHFGKRQLLVRETPGHTDGCLTFVTEDRRMAFTGDALLVRGAGRTDFQQGSAAQLFRSVRERIFSLPDECLLYPAHDYSGRTCTSVAEERAHNPRLGGGASEADFVGYMDNLTLPHPKQLEVAVPANLECGRPTDPAAAPREPSWGPVRMSYAGIPEIDLDWVREHRASLHLLDVRAPAEWDGELGVIDGAQRIPLDELGARLAEVPRDRPVIPVCRSGKRSARATQMLLAAGFPHVANLPGGMLRWRDREGLS